MLPLESVTPSLGLSVPSLALMETTRPCTELPLESAATTESCHGPFAGPPFVGVAVIASDPIAVTANGWTAEAPPPGEGLVTVI